MNAWQMVVLVVALLVCGSASVLCIWGAAEWVTSAHVKPHHAYLLLTLICFGVIFGVMTMAAFRMLVTGVLS